MKCKLLHIAFLLLLIISCGDKDNYVNIKGIKNGYIPIYMDTIDSVTYISMIVSLPPISIENKDKDYIYQNYLMIYNNEKGVHVLDNSTPNAPVPLCYIEIPGVIEFNVKNDIMFVETVFGILYIDISNLPDISNVKVLDSRIYNNKYVPEIPIKSNTSGGSLKYWQNVYFECIDFTKGRVIGWKKGDIQNPKCHVVNKI